MGSLTGHKIDYNGAGALRGQGHKPSKTEPKYPPQQIILFKAGTYIITMKALHDWVNHTTTMMSVYMY